MLFIRLEIYPRYFERYIAGVIEKEIMKSLEKDYLKNVGKYLYFYLTL